MLKAPELIELRRANPVSLQDARVAAGELGLHARIRALPLEPTPHPPRPARRRALVVVLAVAALLAAVVVATPALAWVRDVLPFWSQPTAPRSVQVQFSSLMLIPGTPPGMDPRAVSGETRQVGTFRFGGASRKLWVAPARNGGFCSLWLPGGGGGCSTSGKPLSTGAALRSGVPAWIIGDAVAPTVDDVVIRLSDGSSVRPRIVWVSAPINAGFFAYDVPAGEQTRRDHVTAVVAYDRRGKLVAHQTFTDSGPAG
jgi:hypothetical protein